MRWAIRPFALIIAAACAMTLAAIAMAAPSPRANFLARADSLCLAGSGVEQAKANHVETTLAGYEDDDTATTRGALAYALTGLFVADWNELVALETLTGPSAERRGLLPYATATYLLVLEAKPFIAAVDADDATEVETFAAKIASLSATASRRAAAAGLDVCGNGHGYVVRLRFKRSLSLAAGTEIRLRRQGRTIAHAGEVLATSHSGSGTTALVAIATRYDPLQATAQATLGRSGSKQFVILTDGPRGGARVPYDGVVPAA